MAVFESLIDNLRALGFFDFFLPFVFVMAVVYGVLQKAEVFEDETVDATVAIVSAFLSILGIRTFVDPSFFSQFFGLVVIALLIVLGFVVILGMMGVDVTDVMNDTSQTQRAGAGVAAFFVLVLLGMIAAAEDWLNFQAILDAITGEMALTALMIIGMFAVAAFVVAGD